MDNDIKLFPCYSTKLVNFLIQKGFKYQIVGLHENTKKKFWIFIRSEKLNKVLDEWSETKPKI